MYQGYGSKAELDRRKQISEALMASGAGAAPQNVGEGLSAISKALFGMLASRANRREEGERTTADRSAYDAYIGGMGQPAPAPTPPNVSPVETQPLPSTPGFDVGKIARAIENPVGADRSPMQVAETLIGKGEVPDRDTIKQYLETGGAGMDPVTQAWCAAFVNASLGHAGVKGTGSPMARSFLEWGEPVDTPSRGDVAVFARGTDPNAGHVGFFDSLNPDGSVKVLGGNQGDAVSLADYAATDLLGYRRAPSGVEKVSSALTAPQPQGPGGIDPRLMDLAGREYLTPQQQMVVQSLLQKQIGSAKLTSGQREYEMARQQGFNGSFLDYRRELAKAGRAETNINVNTAEGPNRYIYGKDAGLPAGWRIDTETGIASPTPGGPAAVEQAGVAEKKERALGNAETATDVITTAAQRARDAAKGVAFPSATTIVGQVPWTDSAEVLRQKEVLTAQAKVENLNAMRAASPTGGALGSVTEKESQMLADKAGALDPNSPNFLRDLDDYERTLLRTVHGKDAGDAIFESTRRKDGTGGKSRPRIISVE